MPTFQGTRQASGMPSVKGPNAVKNFNGVPLAASDQDFRITGVTKDSTGAALGGCVVDLFRTVDDSVAGRTVSDASGNYTIYATPQLTHYAVAYKAGSPDVAGTTVNTLVGT